MDELVKRKDYFLVPFKKLLIKDDFNVRFDMGDLTSLKKSIIENGVQEPLSGYKDGDNYVITNGHRRFAALTKAVDEGSLKKDVMVKFMPEEKGYNDERRTLDLIIRNDGKPLNMLEEAYVYERMQSLYGKTSKDIAQMTGKSAKHIDNCFLLLSADPDTIKMIKSGEIAPSTVVEEMRGEVKKTGSKTKAAAKVKEKTGKAKAKAGGKKITKKHLGGVALPHKNMQKLLTQIGEAATLENSPAYKARENDKAFAMLSALVNYSAGKIEFEELLEEFYVIKK